MAWPERLRLTLDGVTGDDLMNVKTNVKAGSDKLATNHSETLGRPAPK